MLVIFDGACGFCTWTVQLARRIDRKGTYSFVPYQHFSLDELKRRGTSPAQCAKAVHAIDDNDRVYCGAFAINRFLWSFGGWRFLVAALYLVFPLLLLEMLGYALVARNRVPISALFRTQKYAVIQEVPRPGDTRINPSRRVDHIRDIAIRRAIPADAVALSDLALRSKSYWGYDAAFLEGLRSALTVAAEYLVQRPVYLASQGGRLGGFYGFRVVDEEPFLYDFWVDPGFIRTGIGRALWHHAIGIARAHDYVYFLVESDPNAEAFYIRMGARRVGERVSSDSGRHLPLLRYDVES